MRHFLIFIFFIWTVPSFAHAQNENTGDDLGSETQAYTQNIINRVAKAYQVDRLMKARTVRLEEERRLEYPSHDYGTNFHDLTSMRRHLVLNFSKQVGATEFLTEIADTYYHGRSVFSDGTIRFIDYGNGTYEQQDLSDFYAEYGRDIRASDVLLAVELIKSKAEARYVGKEMWLGRMCDRIEIDFIDSPPLTVFVDEPEGYISKMTRRLANDMIVSYTFGKHQKRNGFLAAREHRVYAGDEPLYYSFNRSISVNHRGDRRAFEIENFIKQEPQRVDQSELTIDKINAPAESNALSLYHVGQEGAYTSFTNNGQSIMAFGAHEGLAERFEIYKQETKTALPLGYLIVTDHHDNEIAAVDEALALGATLLVTQEGATRISDRQEAVIDDNRVEVIEGRRDFGDVSVFSLATSHAAQVLVAYSAPHKVLLQVDHYASPYQDERFYAKNTAVTLYNALKPFDLSPDSILSTSNRKLESWRDFEAAIAEHTHTKCFHNRPICAS